jgi:hypothetical protein
MRNSHVKPLMVLFLFLGALAAWAQAPDPVGWWKFDDAANLVKAEAGYGQPLELVGTDQWDEGPASGNGCTRIKVGSYYRMQHGIAPNGGGAYVNSYTLQVDFMVQDLGSWYTFFQTAPANDNDGDCFINTTGHIGVAATGYTNYVVNPNEWYRLVVSVKNGTHYRYYLDGMPVLDGQIQSLDGRFSLEPTLLLFGDNDGDDGTIDVAEVAIWDKPLTAYQVQTLGGYGHLQPLDPMQPAGKWKFDNVDNLSEGYIGKDLVLTGTDLAVDGPSAQNRAVRIGPGNYYTMEHGIAPNGGGAYVNEFTLQFDFKVPEIGKWYSFFQTNSGNSNDADCFINTDGKIGVGVTGYAGYKVLPAEWYRLIISVKNGEFFRYYLDGQLLLEGDKQDIDGRFGLDPVLLLFADNDGDDAEMDVAEVSMWGRALSDSEIVGFGGYGHNLRDTTATAKKMVGNWKFDDPGDLLKAEPDNGLPLELVGSQVAVAGPATDNGAVKIDVGSHYKVTHGISGNGGGILVNEYTLMADIKIPDLYSWRCIFQTSPANNSDGDCFIKPEGYIGTAATGYTSYALLPTEWYRLVISVKNGSHYQYYLDGQLVLNGTIQSIDGRFALDTVLLVFADEDGEDNEIACAELSLWNYALPASEVEALGGYGHKTAVELTQADPAVVQRYEVMQNYPNPFNPETSISYALVKSGLVRLDVYNMLGQKVATLVDQKQESGRYTIRFAGANLPTGVYIYKLSVNGFSQTKKMYLCK